MRSKLIEARIKKGLTQAELAKKIGVTRACYANYERGARNPSVEKVIILKEILDTQNDKIFLKDGDTISVKI